MSPRARQAKGKARLTAYEKLLAEEMEAEKRVQATDLHIPPGPRLGDLVVEAKNLRKGYGDKLLIEDLSFKLPPGGIVGVIGANGAGKTTLFRMIVGEEKPDGGTLRIGETVKIAYVDQSRDTLQWRTPGLGGDQRRPGYRRAGQARSPGALLCRGLQFQGIGPAETGEGSVGRRTQPRPPGQSAQSGGNLLLLDEPTNDLDVDTLRSLEDALLSFAGCAVVISHDRWFLDRIATHILAFEGDSKVVWFEGNYQDYEADRKRRLGALADQPHRIRYKPLVRE